MRKAFNIFTLLFFIGLVLTAFNVPDALLRFVLIGEIPGTNQSLPPSVMLAIMTTLAGFIIFELMARRVEIIARMRAYALNIVTRKERLPHRRFERI